MSLKCRSKTACKIANINQFRFNEQVAAGIYQIAPETVKGKPRLFARDDIVSLIVYTQLIGVTVDANRAAEFAAVVYNEMRAGPIRDLRSISFHWKNVTEFVGRANDEDPGFVPLTSLRFDIKALREYVDLRMIEELKENAIDG